MSYKTERAMASNNELRALLEKVPDTYFDFVLGVMLTVVDDEAGQEKMIAYLKENPEATSDDVSAYEAELYFSGQFKQKPTCDQ